MTALVHGPQAADAAESVQSTECNQVHGDKTVHDVSGGEMPGRERGGSATWARVPLREVKR